MVLENSLNIFTDGSSFSRPRVGGIGIRYVTIDASGNEQIRDLALPGYKGATNNQMELHACISALKEAKRLSMAAGAHKIVIYTDSAYVAGNYSKAMFQWSKTRWLTRSGRPVLNADLWKELLKQVKKAGMRVEIRWVKGHAKSTHNKVADKLARESARKPFYKPLSVVTVRRKLSPRSVDVGSVPMERQRMTIRVITLEFLEPQHLWKCKYEVMSRKSKYYRNVDIIYSNPADLLKPGHTYYVKVGSSTSNPRIEKVFREIVRKEATADVIANPLSGPYDNSLDATGTAVENSN
ncbi:MAG: ribonuclease HI [Chloroflexi bacterium]|nr:ribonuclease HI [Chloroflexota bacterium]